MRDSREIKKERALQKIRGELRDISRLKHSAEGKKDLLLRKLEENQKFWSSKVFHHE